jgi:hypothetical protein
MKVLKHFICTYNGCVMQSGVVYSLNNDTTTSFLLQLMGFAGSADIFQAEMGYLMASLEYVWTHCPKR